LRDADRRLSVTVISIARIGHSRAIISNFLRLNCRAAGVRGLRRQHCSIGPKQKARNVAWGTPKRRIWAPSVQAPRAYRALFVKGRLLC
jgi:hypothetical protein